MTRIEYHFMLRIKHSSNSLLHQYLENCQLCQHIESIIGSIWLCSYLKIVSSDQYTLIEQSPYLIVQSLPIGLFWNQVNTYIEDHALSTK